MPGAGARKRHSRERKYKVEHCYKTLEGVWLPKPGFTRRGAQRTVERLYELTLARYIKYECRICQEWHIKPHQTKWRASLLVQLLDEGGEAFET